MTPRVRPADPERSNATIGGRNLIRVAGYYADHPGCTMLECAKALGMDRKTVGKHIRKLREQWYVSTSAA